MNPIPREVSLSCFLVDLREGVGYPQKLLKTQWKTTAFGLVSSDECVLFGVLPNHCAVAKFTCNVLRNSHLIAAVELDPFWQLSTGLPRMPC